MARVHHRRRGKNISASQSAEQEKWLKRNISGDQFRDWFRTDPNPRYTEMKKIEQQIKELEPDA